MVNSAWPPQHRENKDKKQQDIRNRSDLVRDVSSFTHIKTYFIMMIHDRILLFSVWSCNSCLSPYVSPFPSSFYVETLSTRIWIFRTKFAILCQIFCRKKIDPSVIWQWEPELPLSLLLSFLQSHLLSIYLTQIVPYDDIDTWFLKLWIISLEGLWNLRRPP